MKNQHLLYSLLLLGMSYTLAAAQPLSLSQDFDGAASWTFTADPEAYSEDDATDIWEVSTAVGDIAAGNPSNFWGMRDINNSGSGGAFDHTLAFAPIDVSSYKNVEISVDYNAIAWDGGDEMRYELIVDGVAEIVDFFEGQSGGVDTSGWSTQTIAVPDSADSVEFKLHGRQNGDTDYGGWDNISVGGELVPEPSTWGLLGMGAFVVFRPRRTRRKSR